MALSKPNEYNEVPAQQGEATVYAEDINQIISNIEKLKGGQANEAPISNIKELKERLDNLEQGSGSGGNIDNISADKVSFNNDNANLDFSSKYDFPKFKNELKEIYEIKLITDYSINNVSHINDVQDVYNLTLEKSENKYILKGNLNYNNTSQYTSSLNFYIISIDGNNDFGHIISEMFQFINSESNAKENEILIEGLNDFKYNFGFLYAVPILQIKKQDNSNFEIKNYDITLNIEIENIKNNQDFIPINNAGEWLSFFNIQNIKGKTVIKGEVIKHSGSFVVFSHFALENYFDIKTDKNDGYYVEASSMITSNKNKSIKYYIRKEINDGSELSPIYANIPITFYYLEIKHTDNTDIENEEILTFNLTAPKNADVPKIEKEKNIQNAIEVLNKKIISSSPNSILFNRIKKISEININISEQEMILSVYELFTFLPIQKISSNTLSFVTFPRNLASMIYMPKIQVNALYQGIVAIPFFDKNLSDDKSYIINNLYFHIGGEGDNAYVSLVGMTDIDISQKDFSNIYTSCYIKFIYQDGFDNTEVNNSLTVY
ncbi:hypothetical protein OFQ45_01540 [Brachyspira hyodysenteriae]|uniref:hypothetical protein n=1 Tax=Brachyspira hyodysenteriae TaxID=159 RepID=UPI0022CDA5AF|nr:hypothetical protein [Brachyspira hyodysenteriae]MCZ9852180.1 hypothetical protein [Brachyspira hyodysenteriae]MCZ9861803.1 hypothetical protein [Brachyspira hyodysenteriae]MCZ9869101.1 hypothetical protein [Brachyspira hyodysenteriae]MCZ9869137.1 hypothetical protein [Brachyspira hyodysenteriae]MCZ9869657.1 hypothetical protein [Brachyspira hyodysenteriae]